MHAEPEVRSQWPLVGRDELLTRMTAALRSTAASVVVLYGPSGVGKTRLAAEAATILAGDDWLVIPVTASATIAPIPLGAIVPALAGSGLDLDALINEPAGPFEPIRRAIESLAADRRALVIVDDLSLLDGLSLAVLTQLLAAGVVRLIATVRSGDPLPDAILSMWTSDSALRIDVPPLSVDEYQKVLGEVLRGPVAHRTAVELHRSSGGNPLFLRELALGTLQTGQLSRRDGVWQLLGAPIGTPALHDLIRFRLRHLDADSLALIERLAVCQPLTVADLDDLGGRERVIALERAGLLLLHERKNGLHVSLSHPQYVQAVRSSLPRLRVIDLLLYQASITEARAMSSEDELRVAVWRLDAGHPSDASFLVRAAYLATLTQDQATVAKLSAAAIEAGAPVTEMLLLQGYSTWLLGRGSEALELLESAATTDRANPTDPQLTARIAMAHASASAGQFLGDSRGIEVLDAALEEHPSLAASLVASRAVLLLNLEEVDEAVAAISSARPSTQSDPTANAVLALSDALASSARGQASESIAIARAVVAYTASELEPVVAPRRAQMILATALLRAGDAPQAKTIATAALHEAIHHDDEPSIGFIELILGRCCLALGQLDGAARWFRDVLSGAGTRGPTAYRDQAKSMLVLALAWQGNTGEALSLRSEIPEEFVERDSGAALASLWVEAITGGRASACAGLMSRGEAIAKRGNIVLAAALLHAACRLGETRAAEPLRRLAEDADCPLIAAQAAHAEAQASGTTEALLAVGEEWESRGNLLYAAEAFASAAASALRSGRGRDAVGLQNRCEQLLTRCEGAATPLLQFAERTEPLTAREREIAGMAAQGLSSMEIAQRLFLSPRTVNNHLQAVYAKLGIRGRGDLTI